MFKAEDLRLVVHGLGYEGRGSKLLGLKLEQLTICYRDETSPRTHIDTY